MPRIIRVTGYVNSENIQELDHAGDGTPWICVEYSDGHGRQWYYVEGATERRHLAMAIFEDWRQECRT